MTDPKYRDIWEVLPMGGLFSLPLELKHEIPSWADPVYIERVLRASLPTVACSFQKNSSVNTDPLPRTEFRVLITLIDRAQRLKHFPGRAFRSAFFEAKKACFPVLSQHILETFRPSRFSWVFHEKPRIPTHFAYGNP